jgi:hypothetical protein
MRAEPLSHTSRFTFHVSRTMERCVKPELLDELPPADPRAMRSREDLLRVNAWMGNCGIMVRALRSTCRGPVARPIVELGAGDGRFLLRVARKLVPGWEGTSAVLLDRLKLISQETRQGFESLGWRTQIVQADAPNWLEQPAAPTCDAMIVNLFLHHFTEAQLAVLLRAAARSARVFIALEPRRSARSLFFSRLFWVIGCNQVTRHDGPVSVRAGFAGRELSRLWPASQSWMLQERPVGCFSHLFIAQRRE